MARQARMQALSPCAVSHTLVTILLMTTSMMEIFIVIMPVIRSGGVGRTLLED